MHKSTLVVDCGPLNGLTLDLEPRITVWLCTLVARDTSLLEEDCLLVWPMDNGHLHLQLVIVSQSFIIQWSSFITELVLVIATARLFCSKPHLGPVCLASVS